MGLVGFAACLPTPSSSAPPATDASVDVQAEGGADVTSDALADASAPSVAESGGSSAAASDAGASGDGTTQGSAPGDAAVVDGAQASGMDAAPLPACGQIIELPGCQGMSVVLGDDGFLGAGPDGGLAAYDTAGRVLRSFGPASIATSVSSAARAGGVTAAGVLGAVQEDTFAYLVVDTDASTLLTTSSIYAHIAANVAVRDDGRIFVATNELYGADGGQLSAPIPVVRAFDSSATQLAITRPSAPNMTNPGGSLIVTSSHVLYELLGATESNMYLGAVIAYDANLVETARWSAPTGVVLRAFAKTPGGSIVVAGAEVAGNVGTVAWVDELDGATLAPTWPSARTMGTPGAGVEFFGVAVASSGRIFVSGEDGAQSLWVQALDPTGATVWPQRVQTTLTLPMSGAGEGPMAIQSDGALLLNGGFELVPCP